MKEENVKEITKSIVFESGEKIKVVVQLTNIGKASQTKDFLETVFKEIKNDIIVL